MEIHTAKVEPIKIFLTPLQQWHFANDYLYTADLFRQNLPHPGYSPVPYELYCFAIELSLKAFLLAKGADRKIVKDHRHNFEKLLSHADRLSLSDYINLEIKEKSIILQAGELYRAGTKARAIYHSNGSEKRRVNYSYASIEHFTYNMGNPSYLNLPVLEELSLITKSLVTNIKKPCLDAAH